ncbi:hypothetical protein B0H17DRAFT_410182 [Mycena rosella]|uniref:DUF6534 domain-containing protein n=1 Tax=Mycena rosella TaxID=1033263 RepID=A0AAD7CLJ7_MYCRO|nr:hypothetical protein B0H17DRAFT_410182 [Mycena rosella]
MDSSTMESFDVGKLTIPLFIGTVMNWGLLGALLVQVYLYFIAFPNDRPFSKVLVVAVTLAELLQTMSDSRDTIQTFGSGWGNPAVLDDVGWAWFSVPVLGSSIASAGQMFFAWRIYIIGGSLVIPAVIGAVTTVQLGAGIWTGILIGRAGRFSRLQFSGMKPPVAWLSATALADLVVVGGTVFYILKARQPGFRRDTDIALFRIIKVTAETGLLCAAFALIDLALFVAYNGDNTHLAVCIWLSKVYSNSIMAILNSRAHIGHEPAPNATARLTDIVFYSAHTALQVNVETSSTITHDSGTIARSAVGKDEVHAV